MPVSKKRKKSKKQKTRVNSKINMILQHYNSPAKAGSLQSFVNMLQSDSQIQELDFNNHNNIEVISEIYRMKVGIPSITFKYRHNEEIYEIDFIDKYVDESGREPQVYNAWIIKDDQDLMTMKVLPKFHDRVKEDKCKCLLNLYLDEYNNS